MDLNQYLEVFIEESKEHLQLCNEQLLKLEKQPEDLAIVGEIFRAAHTLKGMAATMGFEDLAGLTHQMENVLDEIRNNKLAVTPSVLDVVFSAVDDLEAMVFSIADGGDGKRDVSNVINQLKGIIAGKMESQLQTAVTLEGDASTKPATDGEYDEFEWTVIAQSQEQGFTVFKMDIQLREDCLLKAARVFMVFETLEQMGEVIKSVPTVDQLEEEKFEHGFSVTFLSKNKQEELKEKIMNISEIDSVKISIVDKKIEQMKESREEIKSASKEVQQAPKQDKQDKSTAKAQNHHKTIRVNIDRLDGLMNLFEELVIDRGRLEQISREANNQELTETVERMTRVTGDMQTIILNMRMVPVETVFNRFPRMVRQLAKDLGKKIKLEIIGAETELDRTVIDEIGDPLLHLLRNALDHGIEKPAERKANGKSEEGTIILKAYHSGNHVFIEISDDGGGLNSDIILQKALDKGIITEQAAATMTEMQINELIFASGFSTAKEISDISGRGVGLDVVKNTIESLGGTVSIHSKRGEGSVFSVKLPLTLSIISVMLVEVQNEKYAIPLSSIIETYIVKKEDILKSHNQLVIDFRGKIVPLLFLHDILSIPVETNEEDYLSLVIVRSGDRIAGLVVNSFIGQQEIVLKSLGNYLNSVYAISGATILGDGQVALIIDCNALVG